MPNRTLMIRAVMMSLPLMSQRRKHVILKVKYLQNLTHSIGIFIDTDELGLLPCMDFCKFNGSIDLGYRSK